MHKWERYELKQRAKNVLKLNYWIAFLVALVFMIISGGSPLSGSSWRHNSNFSNYRDRSEHGTFSEFRDEFSDNFGDEYYFESELDNESRSFFRAMAPMIIGAVFIGLILFMVFAVIAIAFDVFLGNPLKMGAKTFFKTSAEIPHKKGGYLGEAFRNGNYGNVVKTMFLRSLFTFLWSLLFIIPGIVKSYSYRMVPYILADNPKMNASEAILLSRKMMDGEKWKTFVLDLSFFGWYGLGFAVLGIIGYLTGGIAVIATFSVVSFLAALSILFVMPYYMSTDAQLYLVLRNKAIDKGYVRSEQLILPLAEA